MFYHILVAIAGVVGLFGLWLGVQALVRRKMPEAGPDSDVLLLKRCSTPGGCHSCGHNPETGIHDEVEEKYHGQQRSR